HLHILIKLFPDYPLKKILHSWKSYTAHRILEILNAPGPGAYPGSDFFTKIGAVWYRDYWDRFVRDKEHYVNAIEYIRNNPVNARLVTDIKEWKWYYISDPGYTQNPPT
ncbi:hypothetical protein JYT61_01145, partial [bacterium AH-315-E10]|nr:hypothetical protein [bacterium AH-315-E10]